MKKNIFKALLCLGVFAIGFQSCELDEYNPNVSKDDTAEKFETLEGYKGLVNQCYQPLYATLFCNNDYLSMCEAGTDLWQVPQNGDGNKDLYYYEGLSTSSNNVKKSWNAAYTSINICNMVIDRESKITDGDTNVIAAMAGEAYMLRAFYYSILVEQFGEITLTLHEETSPNFYPQRSSVEEIYAQIVSDLKTAVSKLPIASIDGNKARATKKTAKGLLARAYIQGAAYGFKDNNKDYLDLALETAEELINNQTTYGVKMYTNFADVFNEANNRNNTEALFIAGGANRESGDAYTNIGRTMELFRYFLPSLGNYSDLGLVDKVSNFVYGRPNSNNYLASKYYMDCFSEYDKRYQHSFISTYSAYSCVAWGDQFTYIGVAKEITDKIATKYGIDAKHIGKKIYPYYELVSNSNGQLAIWNASGTKLLKQESDNVGNFLVRELPLAADDGQTSVYISKTPLTDKADRPYFAFCVNDLYQTDGTPVSTKDIKTQMYPALRKFNMPGSEFYGSNAQNKTSDIFIMRMAEVYMIAAEAAVRLNKPDIAAKYINVLHERACDPADYVIGKMKVTESQMNMDYIFDEYARELGGEHQRWYLLKRNKAFETRLAKYNTRAAKSFQAKNYIRPISQDFLDAIYNADEYGTNGY